MPRAAGGKDDDLQGRALTLADPEPWPENVDGAAVLDVTSGLDTGMIKVNAPTTGVDFWTPFGGVKDSGHGGKEQGKAAVDVFTTTHTVTIAAG